MRIRELGCICTPAFTATIGNFYHIQSGGTPLMAASYVGHVDVVKTLIGSQAQVNTQKEVIQ